MSRLSIRTRVTAAATAAVALVLIAGGLLTVATFADRERSSLDRELERRAQGPAGRAARPAPEPGNFEVAPGPDGPRWRRAGTARPPGRERVLRARGQRWPGAAGCGRRARRGPPDDAATRVSRRSTQAAASGASSRSSCSCRPAFGSARAADPVRRRRRAPRVPHRLHAAPGGADLGPRHRPDRDPRQPARRPGARAPLAAAALGRGRDHHPGPVPPAAGGRRRP